MENGGQNFIGSALEVGQRFCQVVACDQHLLSWNPFRIGRARSLCGPLEISIASEIDELRFQTIEIRIPVREPGFGVRGSGCALAQFSAEATHRLGVDKQVVARV